jgi:hypothetical protein
MDHLDQVVCQVQTSVTKASVEAVLTGPIGTHTHSSISGLQGSEGDLVTGTMANVTYLE